MDQVHSIPNQYGVYLDLIFYSNTSTLRVSGVKIRPAAPSRDIEYLKYVSMCRRVSRFDFGEADVDGIILQLSAVEWSDFVRGDCVDGFVQIFYDAIYECFELCSEIHRKEFHCKVSLV
jgi:hypothetical protein